MIVLLLCLTGCSTKNKKTDNSVASLLSSAETKDDYIKIACGYYECGNSYYNIGKEYCEEKDKTNGELLRSGNINDVEIELLDDKKIRITFVFYRDSYPRITMILCQNGDVLNAYESKMKHIKKEDYDKIKSIQNENQNSSDVIVPSANDEYTYETPWYEEEFRYYEVIGNLSEIERLFAVGKKDDAVKALKEKVEGAIKSKIPELINRREYWLARNYLAMFQTEYKNVSGKKYPFTIDYMQNAYPTHHRSDVGINAFVYDYYLEIEKAAKADTIEISMENAVYKVNELLINYNYPTVTRLRTINNYAYLTDIVENFESVLFFIVNPYTQSVKTLDAKYFFTDGIYTPPSS